MDLERLGQHLRIAATTLIAALVVACGASDPTVVDVSGVAADLTIAVHQDGSDMPGVPAATLSLDVGDTASLAAVATNALGLTVGGVAVAWSSSDDAVVQVSADGQVTAVAAGSADVYAVADELSARLAVVVTGPPELP